MSSVHNIHSTVELPLSDLIELLENINLPENIESIDWERNNNMFFITSEASEDVEVGRYTPTAKIKASIQEKRIYIKADGERTTTPHQTSPSIEDVQQEEQETELVEYACFKGYGDTVLHNKALQVEMFELFGIIAEEAERGVLEGIICTEEGLKPILIDEGEIVEVELSVNEVEYENPDSDTVDWKNNDYISG